MTRWTEPSVLEQDSRISTVVLVAILLALLATLAATL